MSSNTEVSSSQVTWRPFHWAVSSGGVSASSPLLHAVGPSVSVRTSSLEALKQTETSQAERSRHHGDTCEGNTELDGDQPLTSRMETCVCVCVFVPTLLSQRCVKSGSQVRPLCLLLVNEK